MIVSLEGSKDKSKNIHSQIEETIAERNRILPEWKELFDAKPGDAKSIHVQLKETIAEFKKSMKGMERLFDSKNAA